MLFHSYLSDEENKMVVGIKNTFYYLFTLQFLTVACRLMCDRR